MKKLKTIIATSVLLVTGVNAQAQNYEGTFELMTFNCPIDGASEGILTTEDGEEIQIASYVELYNGEYVQTSEYSWGEKKCDGKTFRIYYINDATVAYAQGVKPRYMSKSATDSAKEHNGQYIQTHREQELPTKGGKN